MGIHLRGRGGLKKSDVGPVVDGHGAASDATNLNERGEMTMKKMISMAAAVFTLVGAFSGMAFATPSTQIWIPSTDIQAYKTVHLNIDGYFRASGVGKATGDPTKRDPNMYDVGPTIGILPFEKIQMEVGFDYLTMATEPNDNRPFSGNFKLGTPEDSLFTYSPALAFGMYNIGKVAPGTTGGIANAALTASGQNILYFLAAKTLPVMGPLPSLGRVSAGYYNGAKSALIGPEGNSSNDGLLLSWDRTMTELTDKLWLGVDFMSGHNVDSSVNFGASWAFSKNVSVILGYDIWLEKAVAGNNTVTVQVDINWP